MSLQRYEIANIHSVTPYYHDDFEQFNDEFVHVKMSVYKDGLLLIRGRIFPMSDYLKARDEGFYYVYE